LYSPKRAYAFVDKIAIVIALITGEDGGVVGLSLGGCPRIAIVARARLVELDFLIF
jgi:hypothetical protein